MDRFYSFIILSFLFGGCDSGLMPYQHIQARASHPNIILLIGDDQGYPYLGFMGADYIHTPNMDLIKVLLKFTFQYQKPCFPFEIKQFLNYIFFTLPSPKG